MQIGEVVVLEVGGQALSALVVHVHDKDHLNLIAVSIHETDVGAHGRLTQAYIVVPHSTVAKGHPGAPRWRHVDE